MATGTITIHNSGPNVIDHLQLYGFEVIDPGHSAARAVASSDCTAAGASLKCDVYSIQPGTTVIVHARYKVLTCGDRRTSPPFIKIAFGWQSSGEVGDGSTFSQGFDFHVLGCSSTPKPTTNTHHPKPTATTEHNTSTNASAPAPNVASPTSAPTLSESAMPNAPLFDSSPSEIAQSGQPKHDPGDAAATFTGVGLTTGCLAILGAGVWAVRRRRRDPQATIDTAGEHDAD